MATLPSSLQNNSGLADWLELTAWESEDKDSSAGDLERELDKQNVSGKDDVLAQVFDEIHRRERAAGAAYPFVSEGSALLMREEFPEEPVPYLFCLVLSAIGWKAAREAKTNPWLLFEKLSCLAARRYIDGSAMLFGTGAREAGHTTRFESQMNDLANQLGEGEGYKQLKGVRVQDGKVDLVAWKSFSDRRGSQLVLFGQCAAGDDWMGDKLSALERVQKAAFFLPSHLGESRLSGRALSAA